MKTLMAICIAVLTGVWLSSCYYDVESELYPFDSCQPANATYSQEVLPILQRSCLSCHSAANAPLNANISFEPFDKLLQYVQSGQLLRSVRHESGAVAMPQNASKLNDCEIAKMEAWIANGAQEN